MQKDGRCTSYAKRTHKIKWTNYDYDQSRYDTKIIEKEFEICKFFGNRGDIFLFDTNGLHKRDEKKEKPKRAVAFIDVANHDKCVALCASWACLHSRVRRDTFLLKLLVLEPTL